MAKKTSQSPTTAVAPVPEAPKPTDLSTLSPELLAQMRADVTDSDATAFERDDLAIPFLRLAQDLTPQTKKIDPSYIDGLEAGDLFHTVTGQVWKPDTGVLVVPVAFQRSFTEWKLREQGGGFLKDHGADDTRMEQCTRDEKNRDITPDGTQMVRAALYYLLIVNPDGTFQQAALSLTGTNLKHGKRWNALMQQFKMRGVPTYGQTYVLGSAVEKNAQYMWHVLSVTPAGLTLALPGGPAIYDAAKTYAQSVMAGEVRVRAEDTLPDTPAGESGGAAAPMPF